jgi:DNA (cytosine-5)-methyltransferase 1
MPHGGSHPNAGGQIAIAFTERTRNGEPNCESQLELSYALTNPGGGGRASSRNIATLDLSHTLRGEGFDATEDGSGRGTPLVPFNRAAVRRLTPRECERLQGFEDDYTRIPWGRRSGRFAADGPRYKAIGNSMAVPVMRWIGEGIEAIEVLQ